jgi:pimeloyl-ACP methyl ester carboxylesterase
LLIRVEEVVAASEWVKSAFTSTSKAPLPTPLLPLRGKLETSKGVHLVGHSFGGATVLSAGGRHGSGLFRSVVAHDPAVDWMTDDTRYNLLKSTKYEGTGGYEGGMEKTKGR